jgi:type IV pilus assembly protein PilQ
MIPILILLAGVFSLQAQAATDESLVTLNETTHINDAVRVLETFSLKFESKKMINLSSYNGTIGFPINNLNWRRALELIMMKNRLAVDELPGYIAIKDIASTDTQTEARTANEVLDTKQVKIKSIALVADRAYLKSLGIDWSTLFNGRVVVEAGFSGASQVPTTLMNLSAARTISWDGKTIDINTLLNTIESNQKGTIIAQPVISVNSGKRGFIQVGQDISVKTVDEAGNTRDTFFATGIILDVTPTIVKVDTTEVVHLMLSIERSTGTPGNVSTIINKSKSETELYLYNGEESVIGGLYDTDEIRIRSGIPILKDLPWWVFGIRYLTGYYKYEKKEREVVIIIQVEIVDNAIERQKKALAETAQME